MNLQELQAVATHATPDGDAALVVIGRRLAPKVADDSRVVRVSRARACWRRWKWSCCG